MHALFFQCGILLKVWAEIPIGENPSLRPKLVMYVVRVHLDAQLAPVRTVFGTHSISLLDLVNSEPLITFGLAHVNVLNSNMHPYRNDILERHY